MIKLLVSLSDAATLSGSAHAAEFIETLSALSVSGALDGGGSFDATLADHVQVFSNTTHYALAFTDENVQFDIADTSATTGPYDFNSSFVAGGAVLGNIYSSFATNDGLFAIDSFGGATVTEIAAVPEPATRGGR